MPVFAIHYTYPDDNTEMLTIRPQHRDWLAQLPGLRVAGAYQPALDEVSEGEPTSQEPVNGGLIVVEADSLEDVTTTFDEDPYWQNGYILRRVVRQWDPPLGPWATGA